MPRTPRCTPGHGGCAASPRPFLRLHELCAHVMAARGPEMAQNTETPWRPAKECSGAKSPKHGRGCQLWREFIRGSKLRRFRGVTGYRQPCVRVHFTAHGSEWLKTAKRQTAKRPVQVLTGRLRWGESGLSW